ncbi:hypothetical protein QLH51_07955 [Sphingomonas sp. 2R-10]|uniref:hypothetical protein n=1 Tax=Sphingomonas sp. 2R-10 TaxID=3045148 RepID=UPI000F7B8235|nr:hypothetical protein [Sphingomonas sp. 2R-10]MDJ0276726.1 hypothetical protein [Sphingomonas sp. 2R-10]
MSVDFYVAVPAANWPTAAAVQQCMTDHDYPVQIKRFPGLDSAGVVRDGVLAAIDGTDAYLEGELAPALVMPAEVKNVNDRLMSISASEKIGGKDAVLSIRVRTPNEMRASSYVISALIVCFDGFGFEPQGNTYGRADFAHTLIRGADAIKGL